MDQRCPLLPSRSGLGRIAPSSCKCCRPCPRQDPPWLQKHGWCCACSCALTWRSRGTACKLRLQVPSALRAPAAPHLYVRLVTLSASSPKGDVMSNKIDLPSNWVCDGKELKPKSGASLSNTWIFDGKEIKPRSGANLSNTWTWNGKELKPRTGSSLSNTWVLDGSKIKPRTGANLSNTYDTGKHPILVIAAQLVLRLW